MAIDLDDIEREIRKAEADRNTWSNCEKLAMLYTVRDHLPQQRNIPMQLYSEAAESPYEPSSDFIRAFRDSSNNDAALRVLDEHFNAVMVLYPKEYAAVMKKLRET